MHPSFTRFVSRVLIAWMIWLPFQAQAGMIGTDQAVAAAQARTSRATLAGFVGRADVASQLQALGLSPQAANERIAALTYAEVAALAGRIDGLPAGAGGQAIGILVVLAFLLWRFVLSADAKEPAKK